MTFDEAVRLHPDSWLLLRIIQERSGFPAVVEVLAVCEDRVSAYRLAREVRQRNPRGRTVFSFFTGPLLPPGGSLALASAP